MTQRQYRIPNRTIGRLSVYRRLLNALKFEGQTHVYSHELASLAGVTAAQVRRDLMVIGYSGSPARGYHIDQMMDFVSGVLDDPEGRNMAILGVGHLGRAIMNYFQGRRPRLKIVAAFDQDDHKVNRVLQGVRSYPVGQLEEVIQEKGITVAILTVPAEAAQELTERLVSAGVTGLVNFAPVPLRVPAGVFVENMDITMSLEKVAYFSGSNESGNGKVEE